MTCTAYYTLYVSDLVSRLYSIICIQESFVIFWPCHSWRCLHRHACTWALPWWPRARPEQCQLATGTWARPAPAPPAAVCQAAPQCRTGSCSDGTGWTGCPSLNQWTRGERHGCIQRPFFQTAVMFVAHTFTASLLGGIIQAGKAWDSLEHGHVEAFWRKAKNHEEPIRGNR